jgi:hypothetical protein
MSLRSLLRQPHRRIGSDAGWPFAGFVGCLALAQGAGRRDARAIFPGNRITYSSLTTPANPTNPTTKRLTVGKLGLPASVLAGGKRVLSALFIVPGDRIGKAPAECTRKEEG